MTEPTKKARVPKWQKAFLSALANSGNVRAACRAAGTHRPTVYERRHKDPEFAALWEDALEDAADSLEAEAVRRARGGSDTLLIFLLKGLRPTKWRETTRHELTGPDGGPIETNINNIDAEIERKLASIAAVGVTAGVPE